MGELSSQQSEVKQLASSSLETLHDFQQQSVARDRELEERQEGMREKISHNLEQLAHEKVLINSGQQLLANMTEDIKRQLGKLWLRWIYCLSIRCNDIHSSPSSSFSPLFLGLLPSLFLPCSLLLSFLFLP